VLLVLAAVGIVVVMEGLVALVESIWSGELSVRRRSEELVALEEELSVCPSPELLASVEFVLSGKLSVCRSSESISKSTRIHPEEAPLPPPPLLGFIVRGWESMVLGLGCMVCDLRLGFRGSGFRIWASCIML